MEKFYNLKKRVHGNGLIEYRLYEKACSIGGLREKPKEKTVAVEVPFETREVKCNKFLDADGFACPIVPDAVSLQKSVKRTKDMVFDYSNSLNWEWFCTFTFNADKVDRMSFEETSKKMTKWLNNMRSRYCSDMKYVLVPEKHKDGSWHFHGIFADCAELDFVEAINMQEFYKGKPNKLFGKPLVRNGQQVYDIKKFKLGFTDCTRVRDTKKVASYILKYITKDLIVDTKNRKRYWNTQNLPKVKEEISFLEFEDYDKFLGEFLKEIAKEKDLEMYCNTFQVEHDSFTNKISYIKCSTMCGKKQAL